MVLRSNRPATAADESEKVGAVSQAGRPRRLPFWVVRILGWGGWSANRQFPRPARNRAERRVSIGLALPGGGDAQELAILGDRAAGQLDAFTGKHLDDL